jgi:hypothetical protein
MNRGATDTAPEALGPRFRGGDGKEKMGPICLVRTTRDEDHIIDARERPLQSRGILIVRNAQGDSRWQAPACGLDVPTIATTSWPSDANLETMARPTWPLAPVTSIIVPFCLTHTYLSGYTSINSQQVIDRKCRTLTMCSSERSPIRHGGLSSNDCAATESRRSGP